MIRLMDSAQLRAVHTEEGELCGALVHVGAHLEGQGGQESRGTDMMGIHLRSILHRPAQKGPVEDKRALGLGSIGDAGSM